MRNRWVNSLLGAESGAPALHNVFITQNQSTAELRPPSLYLPCREVNFNWRGGSVTVNVSNISFSNASPVSPGANSTSKFCAIIESDIRKLI
jgi:hypothetical protein